jgi:hypothetical protein
MKKIEISEGTRQAYLEVLEAVVTEEQYSAYGIATVINQILVANGSEKIRPQMMYNYGRNGLIVSGEKIFGTTLRPFTQSEVVEFVIRYCHRNGIEIRVGTQSNPDQLELDLEMDNQV